ncbi:hypothetical protein [Phascolarctobacterium sp.]|jgi:hypothetical protein
MSLKQRNYRLLTALLLLLVIIAGAVCNPLYVESSHGHDCSGVDCPVCLTLSVISSCHNYVLPALLPLLLSLLLLVGNTGKKAVSVSLPKLTLIGLKVRLDN